MEKAESSDRSLLFRIRSGDDDAASKLYYRYVRQLHSVARRNISGKLSTRVEADDIVQSAFRSFFRRASGGEFDVPEGEHLWKLLLTIAINKTRNAATHHGAAKRDAGMTSSEPSNELAAADALARQTLELLIAEVTAGMDPTQQKIIEMRIAGAEVDEIARSTGRAKRSVERVLQGFRNELAAELDMEM